MGKSGQADRFWGGGGLTVKRPFLLRLPLAEKNILGHFLRYSLRIKTKLLLPSGQDDLIEQDPCAWINSLLSNSLVLLVSHLENKTWLQIS